MTDPKLSLRIKIRENVQINKTGNERRDFFTSLQK